MQTVLRPKRAIPYFITIAWFRGLFILLAFGLNASILVSQEDKSFSYKDDRELFERVVRVEEGILKMQEFLDLKLSQIDKRLEDSAKRYEDFKWYIDRQFTTLYWILGILSAILLGILIPLFNGIFRKLDFNTKEIQTMNYKLDRLLQSSR